MRPRLFLWFSTAVLLVGFPLSAPGQAIDPLLAEQIVRDEVILPSPNADVLVGFFYQRHQDPVLVPGQTVAAWDGSFDLPLAEPSYLFWLDDEPTQEWVHPVRFVLLGADSGLLQVFEAESWPVIDGIEYTAFSQLGNASPELIHNSYPATGSPFVGQTSSTSNTDSWVIIAVGRNQDGERERTARENDVERIKDYVSGSPLGPGVHEDNITEVSGTDYGGATRSEVCAAIEALAGLNCKKVYFFYIGHGGTGYMVLKDEDDDGSCDFTYEELACKLLALGDTEVCITIEACHSGSAIDDLEDKEIEGPAGEPRVLKGSVVTSSTKGNTTSREPDGASFIKGLQACGRDPLADADGDGKVSILEAIAWARSQSPIVEDDDPQGSGLGGAAGKVTFGSSQSRPTGDSSDGGGTLKYDTVKFSYEIEDGAVGGKDSTVCATVLYVNNRAGSPHRGTRDICILCYPKEGEPDTLRIDGSKHWRPELPARDKDDPQQPHRRCLAQLPKDCREWKIFGKTNNKAAADVAGTELAFVPGAAVHVPGDLVFEQLLVPVQDGHIYSMEVNGPPSWNLTAAPAAFTGTAFLPEVLTTVRGEVPAGTAQGEMVSWSVIDHTQPDTTFVSSRALIFTPVPGVADGDAFILQAVESAGALTAASGAVDLQGSTLRFSGSSTSRVDPAGQLFLDESVCEPDSGVSFSLEIAGEVQWRQSALISPASGLLLDDASGSLDGGGVFHSAGSGLILRGDLSGLVVDRFHLVDSALDALVADGVAHAHGVIIESSGGRDVVVGPGGDLTLVDSYFDVAAVDVDPTGQLSRRWTTPILVLDEGGQPRAGVSVEITDFTGELVSLGTTDAEGAFQAELEEFHHEGGLHTATTPHTISLAVPIPKQGPHVAKSDTSFTWDATGPGIAEVIWRVIATDVDPPPARAIESLAIRSIHPNPFNPRVTIEFELPRQAMVELSLYDARGIRVRSVLREIRDPGIHAVRWDGTDDQGQRVASGVYVARVSALGRVETRKVVMVR